MFDMYFVSDARRDELGALLGSNYPLAWGLSAPDAVDRFISAARTGGAKIASAYLFDVVPGDAAATEMLSQRWARGTEGVLFGARTREDFDAAFPFQASVLAEAYGITLARAYEMISGS